MVININVQYNGGFLRDIILLTQPRLLPSGNTVKYHAVAFFVFIAYVIVYYYYHV